MKWISSGERSSPNPIQPITFSQNILSQIPFSQTPPSQTTFSQITYSWTSVSRVPPCIPAPDSLFVCVGACVLVYTERKEKKRKKRKGNKIK